MLDHQFDEMEALYNELYDGVIDISRLSQEDVTMLHNCLMEAYSDRFIRRFEQDVNRQIAIRN